MKRILSLLLAAALAVSVCCFSACGSKPAASKPTNVFRETIIEFPDYLSESEYFINQYIKGGDSIYMLVNQYDNETWQTRYSILPFNLTTEAFGDKIDIQTEQTENSNTNLNSFTVADDGTVYLMLETYTYSETGYEQKSELRIIKDGESKTLDIDLLPDEEYGGFFVNSMIVANDGTLVLSSWNGMRLVLPDGSVKKVELGEENNIEVQSLTKIDGKIYATVWNYSDGNGGSSITEFDPASGTFGEALKIKSDHAYRMLLGPDYDYYFNDTSCVWGIDIESGNMTEVLNFINSDINGSQINQLFVLSPDRFFMTRFDSNNGNEMTAAFLDRVPEDEIVEKKMLTLAVSYTTYDLRGRVIEFNKSNDTYRITIDDYSRYNTDDNYMAGQEKLNADIISGKTPDIFLLSSEMPYDVYAAKGLFADLYELMDADASFDRTKYLENIFKAYEYDGKLLTLVPSFQINTFAAKAELLNGAEKWTMKEFMEFAKAHPEISMFDYDFNRSTFVEMFMLFGRDKFINAETGECRFDTDEFRDLLSFAATLSDENFWESSKDTNTEEFWMEYENRFVEDRVLLANIILYNLDYSYKDILNYTLKSEPVFIGFPVSDGNGALITSNDEYAISSRCKFKEGAWEFLKSYITEDAQMPQYNEQYKYWNYPVNGLPIYRPAIDKIIEIAMTPPEANDNAGVIMPTPMPVLPAGETASAVDTENAVSAETSSQESDAPADKIVVDDAVIDTYAPELPVAPDDGGIAIEPWVDPYAVPLTEEQIDKCMELIEGTTHVARYDKDLNDIINEELEPFFAGKQSLDDTVDHIQNRVSIYIGETK